MGRLLLYRLREFLTGADASEAFSSISQLAREAGVHESTMRHVEESVKKEIVLRLKLAG